MIDLSSLNRWEKEEIEDTIEHYKAYDIDILSLPGEILNKMAQTLYSEAESLYHSVCEKESLAECLLRIKKLKGE